MQAVRTIVTSLIVAALAALLPACRSCSETDPRRATGDAGVETRRLETVRIESAPAFFPTAVDLPAPRVRSFELLAAGKAPRKPLRYAATAGEQALSVTVRVETRELTGEAFTPWATLPELRYGLALGRDPAREALAVRGLEMTVGAPPVAAPEVAAHAMRVTGELSQRYREQVQGRRASLAIDARGRMEKLEPADGAPAAGKHTRQEMLQILAESVVPLPEEPVGPGARWRVTMLMRRGAGMVTQVAEYELLAIEKDGTWRVRAAIAQDGEHQAISPPELPPGVTAELLALLWRAEGELAVSPRAFTPRSGRLEIEYRVHSRLHGGGAPVDLLLHTRGAIELATAAAAP